MVTSRVFNTRSGKMMVNPLKAAMDKVDHMWGKKRTAGLKVINAVLANRAVLLSSKFRVDSKWKC